MPHLLLECSSGIADRIELDKLLETLHLAVGSAPTVDLAAVKSRVLEHAITRVGNPAAKRRFIHLTLSLLEGRTHDAKRHIGDELFAHLVKWVNANSPEVSLSLEIREMTGATYWK